jgi:hypothetical protein
VNRGLLLFAFVASTASAWGPAGHEITARIAERYLEPRVKERIGVILGGNSLASVASWADEIRGSRRNTAPWHYINSPISRPDVVLSRDCKDGNCVVVKLAEFAAELRDPSTTERRRREALMFVVHFAGDLHQPLHCSDNGDQGGNKVEVTYFGKRSNLHAVWDSGILGRLGTPGDLLPKLVEEITSKKAAEWRRGTPETWAREAHDAARKVAYRRLPRSRAGTVIVLAAPYARFGEPLVRVQLEKAGVRMAMMLNEALR